MNKVAPVGVIAIFIVAIAQLGFVFNSNVVHGNYLTLIGVCFGSIIATLYLVYRQRLAARTLNVLYDIGDKPWHQTPPNYITVYFLWVLAGMGIVTLANNLPDTGNSWVEEYKVTQISERLIRYSLVEYLELSNYKGSIGYSPGTGEKYTMGQEVEVTLEKGALGFVQITNCRAKRS